MGPLRYEVHPGNVACGYHLHYYTVFLMLALIVLGGGGIICGTKKLLSVLDLCFSHLENG